MVNVCDILSPPGWGATPLWAACRAGHAGVARELCDAGADVTKRGANGDLPHEAAEQHGHVQLTAWMRAFVREVPTEIRRGCGGRYELVGEGGERVAS